MRIKLPFSSRSLTTDERDSLRRWEQTLLSAFGGQAAHTGRRVTPETAMNASALNAAVALKSSVFASLPCFPYRRLDKGREQASDHWTHFVVHDEPNPETTAFEFFETAYAWRILWGNAYAEKVSNGRDGQLWPLHPGLMDVRRDKIGKPLSYAYSLPGGGEQVFGPDEILHVPGLSLNGIKGNPTMTWMREAVALALATEEYSAKFFGQGGHLGGILEYDGELNEDARAKLVKAMSNRSGLDGAHLLTLLEYGIKYKERSVKPSDSQMIESRKFQVTEIARFVGLPPHLVADLERATFSNIEQGDLEFLKYYLAPDLRRFAQRLNKTLLTREERGRMYFEFQPKALLFTDSKARSEYYRAMFGIGAMSQNKILELENENPIEGGDTHYVPLNMVPVEVAQSIAAERSQGPVERRSATVNPAVLRHRIATAYRPVMTDAAARVVRREVADVRRAADKMKNDPAALRDWLEGYYRDDSFRDFWTRQFAPVAASAAAQVVPTCADEMGDEGEVDTERFIADLCSTAADRWAASSRGQLQSLTKRDEDSDPTYDDIVQRLDEWEEKKADKEGPRHAVETVNAVARFALAAYGATKLVSIATGDSTCPYCSRLDGKVVGINKPFMPHGSSIDPGGGRSPLVASGDKFHPPYHQGCDCQIQVSI